MKRLIQIEGDRIVNRIPLEKDEYTIGRGPENDIVLNVKKVSRLHAILVREENGYTVIDKGSMNHVFVNKKKVLKRKLNPGDELNLSRDVTLLYLNDGEKENKASDLLNRIWGLLRGRDFLRLKEVMEQMVSLDSLDNILDIILKEVVNIVHAERGFIALTDETGEIIEDRFVTHNIPIDRIGKTSVFSHSTVLRAIRERTTIFIFSSATDKENLSHSIIDLDLKSVMCSPLLIKEKLVGVLYVDSGYHFSDFSEMERFFFRILSDHAAIAIENARLYGKLEEAAEDARQLAVKAEAASISKSEFLANMSHEIRTPMNGIIGACDLAITTNSRGRRKEYLDIIRSSARSLLGLVNDILDFSKIEAGKFEMEKIPFSIQDVVEEVCDIFFEKLADTEIEFIIDVDPSARQTVVTDPVRLRQVLVNLTSNACKFTEYGEIRISVTVAPPEKDANDRKKVFEYMFNVEDTGIGIASESRFKLFQAFTQADGSVTRKYGGTGLGLAICERIVKMLGGTISVESEFGKGSAFRFSVPLETLPEETGKKDPPWKGMEILLVEKNESARKALADYLDSHGFHTICTENSAVASTLLTKSLKTKTFAAVVACDGESDHRGIQTMGRILKAMRTSVRPLFLLIHRVRKGEDPQLIKIDTDCRLLKPVKPSAVFRSIVDLMGYGEKKKPLEKPKEIPIFRDTEVLLVEDNDTNRKVATEILKSAGVSVDQAEDGFKAVQMAAAKKYNAIFMDIQMPGMDGFAATREIRKLENQKNPVPIVAITAHALTNDRKKCLGVGMTDYISKPIDRLELLDVLRRNIHSEKTSKKPQSKNIHTGTLEVNRFPKSLPGLDIQDGLKRLGGDVKAYLDILKGFQIDFSGFSFRFRKIIQEEDYDTARREAHSLKAASGNISARDVHTTARSLEKAAERQDQTDIHVCLGSAEDALERLYSSITKLISFEKYYDEESLKIRPAISGEKHDPNKLKTSLQKLDEALFNCDPVTSEQYFREAKLLLEKDTMPSTLKEIETLIRSFEFDKAREILKKL